MGSFVSTVCYNGFYLGKPFGHFFIYVIKCYAIMYVTGSYYSFQYISVLITCGVCFVCELSFVVAFYEKSAVGVSYTLGNCLHLFAAS